MKKWLFLLCCYCTHTMALPAQPNVYGLSIDELRALDAVYTPPADTLVAIWNELGFRYFLDNDLAQAFDFAFRAGSLAADINDPSGQSDSRVVLGHVARIKGEYAQAETYYRQAMELREKQKNYWGTASCLNSLAVLCLDDAQRYVQGIAYAQKGIELLSLSSRAEEDHSRLAYKLYGNLGDLYCRSGDREAADRAFTMARRFADDTQLADILSNEGACLSTFGWYPSAQDRLREALHIYERVGSDSVGMAKTYLQLSANAFEQNQIDTAAAFWAKAQQLRSHLDATDAALLDLNKGALHEVRGETAEALACYQRALTHFTQVKNYSELAKIHYNIGNLYYAQEDYQPAIRALEQAQTLVALEETDPDLVASLDARLQDAYQSRTLFNNWLLTGGLAFLLLIIGAVAVIFNYQKRRIAQLQMWQTEQRLDNALHELEVERNFQHLEASEKVLNWVAKELHDRLGSMLSTVKLYLDNLSQEIDIVKTENRVQFDKANTLLDEVCEEVRRISRGAEPANLPDRGLVKEVEHMLQMIQESQQIEVEFIPHGMNQRLDPTQERKIYRMIGILVNNILMHAEASWFSLQINHFVDHLNIMVEDNGKGFDVANVRKQGGTGIKHLYALSAELGGNIQFDREMKKGTAVSIEIPLKAGAFAQTNSAKKEAT